MSDKEQPAREREEIAGHMHGQTRQIHEQIDEHFHGHYHGHIMAHDELNQPNAEISGLEQESRKHAEARHGQRPKVLTIRSHSGISGDILLTGLAVLNLKNIRPDSAEGEAKLDELTAAILPELHHCLQIRRQSVNGIGGWQAAVNLPHEHEHRALPLIKEIIAKSSLLPQAKKRALRCFELLAACESAVHDIEPEQVHFHEVGALDSILDICGVCELYTRLGEPRLLCAPLPIADGEAHCCHGVLTAPAPAVLQLLQGIPVRPFAGEDGGELLTPTGVALLRALDATFGPWPAFQIETSALAYGQREFANAPNGVIFVLGK